MVDINIDWKTGKSPQAFAARMAAFKKRLDGELENAMQDSVAWVEADAKKRAPVDTGTLRASIAGMVKADVNDGVKGYIGSNVEYAPVQEFGSARMGAQPFLTPAIEKNRDRIKDRFREAVDDAARGLF